MIAELFAYRITYKTAQWLKQSYDTPPNYIPCYAQLIMSATLNYEPVKPTSHKSLGDKLKFILIEKFDLRNGTQRLNSTHTIP